MENEITVTTLDRRIEVTVQRSSDGLKFIVSSIGLAAALHKTRVLDSHKEAIAVLRSRHVDYAEEMIYAAVEALGEV